MYLFWVLLISLVRTFWFLKSDFWYSKIHFLAQNVDISKGYPLEILKIIIFNLNFKNLISKIKMYALNWLKAPKINTCSLNEKCDNNGLDLGILKSITLYYARTYCNSNSKKSKIGILALPSLQKLFRPFATITFQDVTIIPCLKVTYDFDP